MQEIKEETRDFAAMTNVPRWEARPRLARLLRVAITLVPLAFVSTVAWQVHLWLGPPEQVIEGVARWVALSAGCTVAIHLLDRLAKRLLPLTILLRMSIVFPDDVPSRFRVAMRYGSTRQLARDVDGDTLKDSTPQEAAERLLGLVAQLSRHDRLTRGHTERVRAYADLIAEEMGFSTEERRKLHWAGLLHDIGKLSVPAAILNKRTALTEREMAQVKLHPNEGWTLVEPLRPWLGEWALSTRDHHERWDGSGYPRGLSKHEISRGGRIIAVADAFDVMTSRHSYKDAVSYDEARAELAHGSDGHFDPDVVRAFLALSLSTRHKRWSLLNWLANSPIVMSVTSTSTIPATVVTSMAVATVAAGAILVPLAGLDPVDEAAAERVAVATTTTLAPPTSTTQPTPGTTPPTTQASTTTTVTTTLAPPSTTAAPPTTVAPPTVVVTTTVVPTTTSIVTRSSFSTGFLGGGTGEVLNLIGSVDGGSTLIVPDDPDPGLTVPRSPAGLIEISEPAVKVWSVAITEDTPLRGHASLRLYVAIKDFADGFGIVSAGLVECERPTASCITLATGQGGFAQVGFGNEFGELEISLGPVDHIVPAGRYLLLTMAVSTASTHDVWVEFGSPIHPSEFRIS